MKQPTRHVWFVKRGEKVTGPFPAKQLLKWRILGRIRSDTQVSVDQVQWQRVEDVAELDPVKHYGDPKDPLVKERIAAVMRWEDERGVDRDDAGETRASRAAQLARLRDEIFEGERKRLTRLTWLFAAVVLVAGAAVMLSLPRMGTDTAPDCGAPAAPNVNWNYCRLDGAALRQTVLAGASMQNISLARADLQHTDLTAADLSFADLALARLSGANLREAKLTGASLRGALLATANLTAADLSYADLSQATIDGAVFTGAKLDKTIWIDGRVCTVGSVGVCD